VPQAATTLVPASRFTIDQLTEAYNQTRVDYLIPMPMNAARLAEYVRVYDIDLDRSIVALDGEHMLGLGMLGVRPGRTWITRLGVLPTRRRRGIGETIVRGLLRASQGLGARMTVLEVIKDNAPGHHLFVKCGFTGARDLLILRRPPARPVDQVLAAVEHRRWLAPAEVFARVRTLPTPSPWTNMVDSLAHAGDTHGLALALGDGTRGWMAFRRQRLILSHIVLATEAGDPARLGHAALQALHAAYPHLDTYAENVAADDPHLPAFFNMGYLESFRRVEMHYWFAS